MRSDERFMRLAIATGRTAIARGQIPFASLIVRKGKILANAHNCVWKDTDITAHGEMVAIRAACKKTRSIDLSGATLYSTLEPCPMCFSAAHWAGVSRIVFGAPIATAKHAGFNELEISNVQLKKLGRSKVRIVSGVLARECAVLFDDWKAAHKSKPY